MAEKRLIDADRFENAISKHRNTYFNKEDVIAAIANQPTVDAVEVVRCRDCKHWINFDSSLIGEVMRCTGQGAVNIMKRPDDFCSCGKRKEGDANG